MNKYTQIIDYIKDLTQREKIKTGEKLPSVRSLADKFQCSTLTIVRAYKELEQEHYIYSVPKSGYYLVSKQATNVKEKSEIDFSTVLADINILPYDEFHHCLDKSMAKYKADLFCYGDAQGLPTLIEALRKYLQDYQVFCKSSQIVVTSGSQQAASILINLQFPNEKNTILVENPTYDRMVKNLKLHSARIIGINREFDGVNLDDLEKIFKEEDIKFFYTVPRFHNPTGSSYSVNQKKEILKLANKYDVYILEDDYLVDLETDLRNDSMYSLDNNNRVIYIKTFSKILLPGLRIAAVILPETLVHKFLKYKQLTDIHTSILPQGALEIYINNGMFKRSKMRLMKVYKERMEYLKNICNDFNPKVLKANIPHTGFFLSLKSNNPINYDTTISKLEKNRIIIKDIRESYLEEKPEVDLIKISISKTDNKQIKEGMLDIYNYFLNQKK
ncbi:aminotransferase-like domain-containing protein [Tepidibacter mesophilus]|uniref:aminotransferase-like domain-containing protein n=1 Tax=Tepidibacter mesophilus TaxID=655607 RepID=UPI000C078FF2|nr:PLP-dependent aminotransferase family protein [Tepidibacter mesophilus]